MEPDIRPLRETDRRASLQVIVLRCLGASPPGFRIGSVDWRVTGFFLDAKIPHKAPWLLAIGELGRPLAPIWLLLLWAWAAKRPRLLLAGLLAMLLTLCTVLPIKSAVGRVRPDEDPAEVMQQPFYERSYSFPSGDATLAFAVATVAAGFISPRSVRWLPFLLAAMAGVTRLMLLQALRQRRDRRRGAGNPLRLRGAADQPQRLRPKNALPRAAEVLAARLRHRGASVSDL